MKPRNQNARKPDHLKTWNKGRITVDLGTARKERFLSYAKHEKRTMKEILICAVDSIMGDTPENDKVADTDDHDVADTDPFRIVELNGDTFKVGDIVDCYRPPIKSPELRGTVVGGSPVSKDWVRVRPEGSDQHFSWHKENLKLVSSLT